MLRARHQTQTGLEVVTEPHMEPGHKLPPELRKQRRADNKHMAKVRKITRKRKKHGRP